MWTGLPLRVFFAGAVLAAFFASAQTPIVLYEYDDGSGPQQVETLSAVPRKFRSKARKVTLETVRSPSPSAAAANDAKAARKGDVKPPLLGEAPALPRVYCKWKATKRPSRPCKSDRDCGPDYCVMNVCVPGVQREADTIHYETSQWSGCLADNADPSEVKLRCEADARAKTGESAQCDCSTSPAFADPRCR